MNRDTLSAQTDAHLREQEVRLRQAFDNGRRFEQNRIRRSEWRKLFGIVVAGSVIGCGIILALAVGLTNLPIGQPTPAVATSVVNRAPGEIYITMPCSEFKELMANDFKAHDMFANAIDCPVIING
jgi:hypothetical protein